MKLSKFLKDILTTGFSQIIIFVFGIMVIKLITLFLKEQSFGLYIIMRRWEPVLVPAVTLNLSIGLARYVSFDMEKSRQYLHISLLITTALSAILCIPLLVATKFFSGVFFDTENYSSFVFILAFFLFANVIHLVAYSYFRGKMDMNTANLLRILFFGFPVLLGFIFLLVHSTNEMAVLSWFFLLFSFWGLATSLFYLRKELSFSLFKDILAKGIKINFIENRDLFLFSLIRIPSLIFISLSFSYPVFLANHKISMTAAGHLGVVVQVLHVLSVATMPFNLIFLPKFSSLVKSEKIENIKHYSMIILDFIITFLPFVVIMIYGLSRLIVSLWFGPLYLDTVSSVALAVLASFFYLAFALVRGILDGLFVFPFINIINFIGFLVIGVLALTITPGIFGYTVAIASGLFMLGVVSIFVLVKKLRLTIPWLRCLEVLIAGVTIFLLLKQGDLFIAGLKTNKWAGAALYLTSRAVMALLLWIFYWRKTTWYGEMMKRIKFKQRGSGEELYEV